MSMINGTLASNGMPPSPNLYKRAVVRSPPKKFVVEILSPMKQGAAYSYGMRICPLRTTSDNRSIRSNGSDMEYEVWRRWEDCLDFQDTLEEEYWQMSRQKRKRLQAGKGVKKNGVYQQADAAASFDSLPPGPDPNMIAQDIHEILPKLNKKGVVFRASAALVEQRGTEFHALIDALFAQEVPALIQELRTTRTVLDFFAVWRRDKDYEDKINKGKGKGKGPAPSTRSSVGAPMSMYFTASNISLQLPPSPALPTSMHTQMGRLQGRPVTTIPGRSFDLPRPATTMGGRAIPPGHGMPPASAPPAGQFHIPITHPGSTQSSSDEDTSLVPPTPPGRHQGFPIVGNVPSDRRRHLGPQYAALRPPQRDDVRVVSDDIPVIMARGGDFPESRQASTISGLSGLESLPEHDGSYGEELVQELPIPVPRTPKTPADIATANRNGLVFFSPPSTPISEMYDEDDDGHVSETNTVEQSEVGLAYLREDSPIDDNRSPTQYRPSSRPLSMAYTVSSRTASDDDTSLRTSGSQGSGSNVPFERFSVPQSNRSSFSDMGTSEYGDDVKARMGDGDGMQMSMSSLLNMGEPSTPMQFQMPQRIQTPTLGAPPPRPARNPLRMSLISPTMSRAVSDDMSWHGQFVEGDDLIDSYLNGTSSASSPVDEGQHSFAHNFTSLASVATPTRNPQHHQYHVPSGTAYPASVHSSSTRSGSSQKIPGSPATFATGRSFEYDDGSSSVRSINSIAIKAVLDDIIVAFRVPREMSLKEVRARLAEKCHAQAEGALSEFFSIACVKAAPPPSAGATGRGRPRASSTASQTVLDKQNVQHIFMESDWREVMANAEDRLTLRVINSKR